MAALGDERLFELLESGRSAHRSWASCGVRARGAIAEVVERCAWAKVEVVIADERERRSGGGRITLNLGHSLGHAVEAAAGYGDLLHGEAVAYGLRAATRIGMEVGVTPPERAGRIGALLDRLDLATRPLPFSLDAVMATWRPTRSTPPGSCAGSCRPPTASSCATTSQPEVVERAATALLGAGAESPR